MAATSQQRLSIRKAAGLIYRTSQPTGDQVKRVLELIAAGELAGDTRGTTAEAVADFIARAALGRNARRPACSETSPRRSDNEKIQHVYRHSLKDYFLAVILRRKVNKADKRFRQAVMAGQIAVLLLAAMAMLLSLRTIYAPLKPERAAALQWLEENTPKYRVHRWYPPVADDDGNLRLRVEYHYVTEMGKGVDTVRVFTVADGRVISVDSLE